MTATLSVPTIRTERLLLRPPRPADAGAIAHYVADPRVAMMTTSIPHPYPPGAAEAWLESLAAGRVAEDVWVIDASPIAWSEMVGIISFRPEQAEIGYWVGVPFQGTGFASEAVGALVAHLFATRALPRITASVMVENDASLRVLQKVGFVRVGEQSLYSVARGAAVPGVLLAIDRA